MALIFMDSCQWDTTDAQYKYYAWNDKVYGGQSFTRRTGAKSIKLDRILGPDAVLTLDLPSIPTAIFGAAYYFTQIPGEDWLFGSLRAITMILADTAAQLMVQLQAMR